MLIPYLDFVPSVAAPMDCAPTAAIVGRTVAGPGLVLRDYATLRADGEWVRVGANAYFGERATVHIADGTLAANIGDDVTVGRFALVHACTVEDRVVVGDTAIVMDDAHVGAGALITAGSLVPPRKRLPGGWIYDGYPATPVREIGADELARSRGRRAPSDPVGARDGERPAAARHGGLRCRRRRRCRVATSRAPAAPRGGGVRRADRARRRRCQRRRRRQRLFRLRARRGRRPDRDRTAHERAGQFAARDRCRPRSARARGRRHDRPQRADGRGDDRRSRADRDGIAGRRRRDRRGGRMHRRAGRGRRRAR